MNRSSVPSAATSVEPPAVFNPLMLRLAREHQVNMTQGELAKRIGSTQSKVSRWEDALSVPSADEIKTLADELRFPQSFFFQPGEASGFGTCCLYHRKRKSLPVKTLSVIHSRINVIGMGISKLLAEVKVATSIKFPRMDIAEHESPEAIANMVRGIWRVPLGPVSNVMHYAEAAGAVVIPLDFGTDKIDAVSMWPDGSPPLLFFNREASGDRQRHTVCHELGHLIMHRLGSANAEEEADRFASEFLMPTREIKRDLLGLTLSRAAELKARWRVSMASLVMKAGSTGAITSTKKSWLFVELSRMGYRKREPVEVAQDEPKVLRKIIHAHTVSLKRSGGEVAELAFCLNVDQFFERFGIALSGRLRIHN